MNQREDAAKQLAKMIAESIEKWSIQSDKSESFNQATIMSALSNLIVIFALRLGVPEHFVIMVLRETFNANSSQSEEDEPVVH